MPQVLCRRRERAKAKGVKMVRRLKLPRHLKKEAFRPRDQGEKALAQIGRSYNVLG